MTNKDKGGCHDGSCQTCYGYNAPSASGSDGSKKNNNKPMDKEQCNHGPAWIPEFGGVIEVNEHDYYVLEETETTQTLKCKKCGYESKGDKLSSLIK